MLKCGVLSHRSPELKSNLPENPPICHKLPEDFPPAADALWSVRSAGAAVTVIKDVYKICVSVPNIYKDMPYAVFFFFFKFIGDDKRNIFVCFLSWRERSYLKTQVTVFKNT